MAALYVSPAIPILALLTVLAGGCSPPMGDDYRELTLPEKVQASDVVIYGEVRRTYPDPRFDYGSGISSAYTAEMTVFCCIRGRRTKAIINVTEAGTIPGLCTSTELLEGQRYIVMLRRDRNNRLTPAYAEVRATQANLIATTSDCYQNIQYPRGITKHNAPVMCPIDNDHLACPDGKENEVERTPPPSERGTPRPKTNASVNRCSDEEATNVISEDCRPRVNSVTGHNGAQARTVTMATHSLLICSVALMFTVVMGC